MPSLIPLDNLLGAAFIGIIVSTAIYGITCLQTYLYYTEYSRRDSVYMKIFVAGLLILDSFHVALLGTFYYYYTVTNFGDYAALAGNTWSSLGQIVAGAFLCAVVQFFFAWRVWQLGGRRPYFPIAICILAAAQLGLALGYIATVAKTGTSPTADANIPYSLGGLVIDIACDLLITACMIYYLWKSRTAFMKTNRAITMLITYALNTGLATTTVTVACLIAWVADPHTFVYSAFYFVLVRLYSCSLMSTLNSREAVREVLSSSGHNHEFVSFSRMTAPIPDDQEAIAIKPWPDHPTTAYFETGAGTKASSATQA